MDLRNVKKIKIGNAELKTLGINGKVAWQGLPEFKVDDTLYNPDTFPFFLTIENNANVVFTNFDSSSYKLTVFLIGGGGAGSQGWVNSQSHRNATQFECLQSGAGGGGGEVKTVTPTITENTNYPLVIGNGGTIGTATTGEAMGGLHKYLNTTASTDGGSTSAFGSTASGGKAGQKPNSGNVTTSFTPQGGSSYAKGGNGIAKMSQNQDKPMPTVGATGTTINGVVYGSGGSGGGYSYDYGVYNEWQIATWYNVSASTTNATGHGNYGSGGNGGRPHASHLNGAGATAEILTQPENGFKGAVILKIEEI